MKTLSFLFLDDERDPAQIFPRTLLEKADITICRTADAAWEAVCKGQRYDMWSLDHDLQGVMQRPGQDQLFRPSGYDFLLRVQAGIPSQVFWPRNKVLVHSANPWGANRMRDLISEIDAKIA